MFKWLFKVEDGLRESGTTIPDVTVEPVVELPKFDISNFHNDILDKVVRKKVVSKLIESIDPEYYSREYKTFLVTSTGASARDKSNCQREEHEAYREKMKPLLGVTLREYEPSVIDRGASVQYHYGCVSEETVLKEYFYSLFAKELNNLVESLQTKK